MCMIANALLYTHVHVINICSYLHANICCNHIMCDMHTYMTLVLGVTDHELILIQVINDVAINNYSWELLASLCL